MSVIAELAQRARDAAASVLRRHQKHASLDLYKVLAQCMELCTAVERSNSAQDEMRELIVADRGDKVRTYVERDSDAYTLACRFVFAHDASHANICRYAAALREAGKIGLTHDALFDYLRDKGGVNALYLRRPLRADQVSAKILHLDRSVTMPKGRVFTLTLLRRADNVFEVQDIETKVTA